MENNYKRGNGVATRIIMHKNNNVQSQACMWSEGGGGGGRGGGRRAGDVNDDNEKQN